MIDEAPIVIMFWLLTLAAIVGGLGVIFSRNLVHAVLFLVLAFIAMAGLFLTLAADFVAVAQVLIYVGAIAILMLFAIMLTPRTPQANENGPYTIPALLVGALFAVAIAATVLRTEWGEMHREPFQTTAAAIGAAMVNKYVLPFEIAGVLLTVALIGAVVLVRED